MSYSFSVDLTALERAADGVNDVLGEFAEVNLGLLAAGSGVTGDDGLAGALSDFCSRWQRGVANLASEGRQIAERLDYAMQAYTAYEEATRQAAAEGGTVSAAVPDLGAAG